MLNCRVSHAFQGMDEDKGPQSRKLYVEVWPARLHVSFSISPSFCVAVIWNLIFKYSFSGSLYVVKETFNEII